MSTSIRVNPPAPLVRPLSVQEMQRAVLKRDAAYQGLFFLGVKTTGIFCRPTCPARRPRPENIEYFATAAEAVAAGYRACKRCRPLQTDNVPTWAADLLREVDADPAAHIPDDELSTRGIDPATVRRYFQSRFGMTFQQYCRARRVSTGLAHLGHDGDIDAAVFESGFGSHSGFRDAFARLVGQTPGRYRGGSTCVRLTWIVSPLGPLVAGATDDGVCLLEFGEPQRLESQMAALHRATDAAVLPGPHEHLDTLEVELRRYFAGELRSFSVPIHRAGTPFQQRVWDALLAIPYGETRSYEELAAAIDSPSAARAVGRANGQNRIAIVIPCHRVVNKSGALGGYGGGLRRKEYLLGLEKTSAGIVGKSD